MRYIIPICYNLIMYKRDVLYIYYGYRQRQVLNSRNIFKFTYQFSIVYFAICESFIFYYVIVKAYLCNNLICSLDSTNKGRNALCNYIINLHNTIVNVTFDCIWAFKVFEAAHNNVYILSESKIVYKLSLLLYTSPPLILMFDEATGL